MIDRDNRRIAARLIRSLRDGAITNDAFEDAWPRHSEDRALRALATMTWQHYSDQGTHTLTGRHAPSDEAHEALSRYALFADGDLPYEWRQHDYIGIGGLGPIVWLSLGLLWPLDAWIKRRNAREEARLRAEGDLDCWPFLRRADLDTARRQAAAVPPSAAGVALDPGEPT